MIFLLNGQKVSIQVYYECLCPDSIVFITNQLYPTYKSDIGKYLDIELVPSFASASVNFTILFTLKPGNLGKKLFSPNSYIFGSNVQCVFVHLSRIVKLARFLFLI